MGGHGWALYKFDVVEFDVGSGLVGKGLWVWRPSMRRMFG